MLFYKVENGGGESDDVSGMHVENANDGRVREVGESCAGKLGPEQLMKSWGCARVHLSFPTTQRHLNGLHVYD